LSFACTEAITAKSFLTLASIEPFDRLERGHGRFCVRAFLNIDEDLLHRTLAKRDAEQHSHHYGKSINPKDGFRLAEELSKSRERELNDGRILHGVGELSIRCRPVNVTKTSSRLACRVVRFESSRFVWRRRSRSAGNAT